MKYIIGLVIIYYIIMEIRYLILKGEKKEESRELKDYWFNRLTVHNYPLQAKHFDVVCFYNGGSPSKKYPHFYIEYKGIDIGEAKPEWSDNWKGDVFRIKLGDIIETKNLPI